MPTYVYKCEEQPEDKNHEYKETRRITDDEPEKLICKVEGCNGRLIKVFFAPPIQFGHGFGGSIYK